MSTNDERPDPSPARRVSSARTSTGPLTFIQLQAQYAADIRELTRSQRKLRGQQRNPATVRRLYLDDTDDYL